MTESLQKVPLTLSDHSASTSGSVSKVSAGPEFCDDDFSDEPDNSKAYMNVMKPWAIQYNPGDEYPYGTKVTEPFECHVHRRRLKGAKNHEWFVHWKHMGDDKHLFLVWSGCDKAMHLFHGDRSMQLIRRGEWHGVPLQYARPSKESKNPIISSTTSSHTAAEPQMLPMQDNLSQQPSSTTDANKTAKVIKLKVKGTQGLDQREPGNKSSVKSGISLGDPVSRRLSASVCFREGTRLWRARGPSFTECEPI